MEFNVEVVQIGPKKAQKITLNNTQGMSVELLSLGGIITKIMVPDAKGNIENIVLGYKNLEDYLEDGACFGALIGRTAGRIGGATFTLNDKVYKLPANNGKNTLHGGIEGFNKKVWRVDTFKNEDEVGAILSYTSPHLEEGYPGNLEVKVTYTLTNNNELIMDYEAISDEDTLVNMTNHSYFNLSGDAKNPVTDHVLQIHSDRVCELDADSIPTGKWIDVKEETAFDFNMPKCIGIDIDKPSTKLQSGYDHPWIKREQSQEVITYKDLNSGRCMHIETDQKAVVIYSMNFADDPKCLQNGGLAKVRMGICFETQAMPIGYDDCFIEDSILRAGEKYKKTSCFKFEWK